MNIGELVSIIMPAYNADKYIKQSIESVITQTYTNWELIIVNDCSTDSTFEIASKYSVKDSRIKVINLEKNSGVAAARNKALEVSQGVFIAFLDSDDIWKPNKLEIQINFMVKENVEFSYTAYEWIDKDSNRLNKKIFVQQDPIGFKQLLKTNYLGCLTIIIKKEILHNLNFPKIKHEDYALWLNILKKNNIYAYGINTVLAFYRITPGSLSRNKLRSILWVWKIYRENLQLSKIQSIYRIFLFLITTLKKYSWFNRVK